MNLMTPVKPDQLSRIQDLIYSQSSLRFSPARLCNLESRLLERMGSLGLDSYDHYYRRISSDREEFDRLIEGITTKETYFFRIPAHFKSLREQVLPELESRLAEDPEARMGRTLSAGGRRIPLRVWSAGCSTGQEPYTIAMALLAGLRFPRAWNLEVLATDISRESVRNAAVGFFDHDALARLPADARGRFFTEEPGGVRARPELRDRIKFGVFNLRDLPAEDFDDGRRSIEMADQTRKLLVMREHFHVVFCRNVMIYFDFEAQQRLVDGLYNCLKPGGWLFTGDAELLHIYRHGFESVEREGAVYYRKPGN